jgi:hypothetical protein
MPWKEEAFHSNSEQIIAYDGLFRCYLISKGIVFEIYPREHELFQIRIHEAHS